MTDEDETMDLHRFVEKWGSRLGASMPSAATHNYVAWCLLYMDEWDRSPYMTEHELGECASDYLEVDMEACSSVTHQAKHVLAAIASEEMGRKLTSLFARAATAAIAEHHQAGRSVHGMVDGKWVEIPPPKKPEEAP